MHANVWNVRHCKHRLGDIERTYAQKRHLEHILAAKSTVNSRPSPTVNSSRVSRKQDPLRSPLHQSCGRSHSHSRSLDHADLSHNLKAYSSMNRLLKQKEIQQENSRLLCRIIAAPATLKREQWARTEAQHEKYRENLHRRKQHIDYSKQAIKLIRRSPRFKFMQLTLGSARSSDRLAHIRI